MNQLPTVTSVDRGAIARCTYCIYLNPSPEERTPVHCTKYSGAAGPILVNLTACFTCTEYAKQIIPDKF